MRPAPENLETNFRAAAFAIVNCYVNQQRHWMASLRMDPQTSLVYAIIALASIQKIMRLPTIPESFRGIEPLPQNLVGTISRRAVAEASGIPREQVRRIINRLLADGRLIESGQNAVRVIEDTTRREGLLKIVAAILPDIAKMTQELRRVGVLVDLSSSSAFLRFSEFLARQNSRFSALSSITNCQISRPLSASPDL